MGIPYTYVDPATKCLDLKMTFKCWKFHSLSLFENCHLFMRTVKRTEISAR